MELQTKKDPLEKVLQAFNIGQVLFTLVVMYFAIYQTVINGKGSTTSWITGIFLAFLAAIFSYAVYRGFQWLEKLSEWLEGKFKMYTSIRRLTLSFFVASAPVLAYWATTKIETGGLALRVIIFLLFGVILPAAIVSLILDDRVFERSALAKLVSRETFTQNPQAAVAHAFTVLEQKMKDKMSSKSSKGGVQLISEAFGGEKSKLVLLMDDVDHTSHMRDLMSGAFALFRNQRHHNLVEDDEHTASALYSLAGLLLDLVEKSEIRKQ